MHREMGEVVLENAAFLVAFFSFVLQIVPLGEVANPALFAAKVTAVIFFTNGLGAYLYWTGARRLRAAIRS